MAHESKSWFSAAWPVFVVVFAGTIGAGILALPIVMAPFGPIWGVAIMLVLGLLLSITIGIFGGALARSASIYSGQTQMAVLIKGKLGPVAANFASGSSIALIALLIPIYLVGFADTFSGLINLPRWLIALVVGIPATVFAAANFRTILVRLAIVTVPVTLISIFLLIFLLGIEVKSDLVFSGLDQGASLPAALALTLGVSFTTLFGHYSLSGNAPSSLKADPTGRGLIRGAVAAILLGTFVNAAWIFVALGSVPGSEWSSSKGTGAALAVEAGGTSAEVLMAIFVLFAMGAQILLFSFTLRYLVLERLPRFESFRVDLVGGRVMEAQLNDPNALPVFLSIALNAKGEVVARVRQGRTSATELIQDQGWNSTGLVAQVATPSKKRWLAVDVEHLATGIALNIETTVPVAVVSQPVRGVFEVLESSDSDREIIRTLARQPVHSSEIAAVFRDRVNVGEELESLEANGLVELDQDGNWRVTFGRRSSAGSIAESLLEAPVGETEPRLKASIFSSPKVHTMITVAMLSLCVGVSLLMLVSPLSFSDLISFVGVLSIVYLAGVLNTMLGISSRRTAERVIAKPVIAIPASVIWVLTVVLFLVGPFIMVFSQDFIGRAAGAVATIAGSWAIYSAFRRGSFRSESTLNVQIAYDGSINVEALHGGKQQPVQTTSTLPTSGRKFVIELPNGLPSPTYLVTMSGSAQAGMLGPCVVASGSNPLSVESRPVDIGEKLTYENTGQPLTFTWTVH